MFVSNKYKTCIQTWRELCVRVREGQLKSQRTVGQWLRARCCHRQLLPNAGTENVMTHAKDSSARSVFPSPRHPIQRQVFSLRKKKRPHLSYTAMDAILFTNLCHLHTHKNILYPNGTKRNAIFRTIFMHTHTHTKHPSVQQNISV